MGIPNYLTMVNISNKNCFQYAGVPFTELINEIATNLLMVPLKLFLTPPAVSVPGLILCIAKFIDEHK